MNGAINLFLSFDFRYFNEIWILCEDICFCFQILLLLLLWVFGFWGIVNENLIINVFFEFTL